MNPTIQIRKLELSDAQGMQEIYACPSLFQYFTTAPPYPRYVDKKQA